MKVLILQGGYNEEHKVSLNTAKQIGRALALRRDINHSCRTFRFEQGSKNAKLSRNPPRAFAENKSFFLEIVCFLLNKKGLEQSL